MKKLFITALMIFLFLPLSAYALDAIIDGGMTKNITEEDAKIIMKIAEELSGFVLSNKNMAEIIKNNALAYYAFVFGDRLNITRGCFGLIRNCSGSRDKNLIIEQFKDWKKDERFIHAQSRLDWINKDFNELVEYFTTTLAIANARLHYGNVTTRCINGDFLLEKKYCTPEMIYKLIGLLRRIDGEEEYFRRRLGGYISRKISKDFLETGRAKNFANFLDIFTRVKIPYDIDVGCRWNITRVTLHGLNVTTMQQYLKIHKGEGIAKTFSYDTLIPFFNWFLCYGGVVDQEDMTGGIRYLGGMIRRGYYKAFANYYERFVREYLDVINRH